MPFVFGRAFYRVVEFNSISDFGIFKCLPTTVSEIYDGEEGEVIPVKVGSGNGHGRCAVCVPIPLIPLS